MHAFKLLTLTYDDAAGAADRGAGASVARADADDGDGAADQTKGDSEVLQDNTDALEQRGAGSGGGLSHGV